MPSGPRAENVELALPGGCCSSIGEVDDHALFDPVDGGTRLIDEALQAFGEPVIAPGLAAIAIHPLLDDDPASFIGDNEAVQIEIEAVLHRCAVDLGDQPARFSQRRSIDADPIAD